MEARSIPVAAAAIIIFFLSAMALPTAAAAAIEHTFVVSQMNVTHLCKETLVTVVNGQLPGPVIEVTEGDSVAVHVVNKSPYNITIHWHGVKQRLNCWADGVPMITQCPIRPGHNFTYRFNVAGQEGTLWWHAHVSCLRGTVHGPLIIRPRHGASSYPFPKPHREIPIVIGEWREMDLVQLNRNLTDGFFYDRISANTMNGMLGDLYNCSGAMEDGYELEVEPGKTYLLRFINAALLSEQYIKIAGHRFTVVAADANYVSPYTTNVVAVAPGQTVDALVVADAAPGKYYIVAQASQPTVFTPPQPNTVTRGLVRYRNGNDLSNGAPGAGPSSRPNEEEEEQEEEQEEEEAPFGDVPMVPEMPNEFDMMTSFFFHGNLTGLRHPRGPPVPVRVDQQLFIVVSVGSICRHGRHFCRRSGDAESIIVATLNNVSFQLPESSSTPLLDAHYYRRNGTAASAAGGGVEQRTLPDRPPRAFNFTDRTLIPFGPNEAWLEPTEKATTARRFRHGAVVEVVFQDTAVMQSESNPMHLHGHDMFVLAQGLGNYDAARAVASYNLVDPPMRNTVLVPSLGWVAVRFVADNPGVWYVHCHNEFHATVGMATVFIVEDGPTVDSTLPPPPVDLQK